MPVKEGKHYYLAGGCKPAYIRMILKKLTAGPPKKWNRVYMAVVKSDYGGLHVQQCKQCKAN
eukprot:scaffold34027_cov21-Tisochrysis_lutea.AAC.1